MIQRNGTERTASLSGLNVEGGRGDITVDCGYIIANQFRRTTMFDSFLANFRVSNKRPPFYLFDSSNRKLSFVTFYRCKHSRIQPFGGRYVVLSLLCTRVQPSRNV